MAATRHGCGARGLLVCRPPPGNLRAGSASRDLWRRGTGKNLAQMQKGDARRTRRCFGAADEPFVTHWIAGCALSTFNRRLGRGSVAICVFCVHRLLSALKFLLCFAVRPGQPQHGMGDVVLLVWRRIAHGCWCIIEKLGHGRSVARVSSAARRHAIKRHIRAHVRCISRYPIRVRIEYQVSLPGHRLHPLIASERFH